MLLRELKWSQFLLNEVVMLKYLVQTVHATLLRNIHVTLNSVKDCYLSVMAVDYSGIIYSIILSDPYYLSLPTTVPICCELDPRVLV